MARFSGETGVILGHSPGHFNLRRVSGHREDPPAAPPVPGSRLRSAVRPNLPTRTRCEPNYGAAPASDQSGPAFRRSSFLILRIALARTLFSYLPVLLFS